VVYKAKDHQYEFQKEIVEKHFGNDFDCIEAAKKILFQLA